MYGNRGRGGGNRGRGGGNRQGGFRRNEDDSNVEKAECGVFDSKCLDSVIFKLCTADKSVPLTQTFLYDSNNNKIGKIKDVYGPMDNVFFQMEPNDGSVLQSIKAGAKVFAPVNRLHPPSFYTDDQQPKRGGRGGGRGGRGGGGRGGRGGGGGRGGHGGGGRGGRGGGRGGFGRGR